MTEKSHSEDSSSPPGEPVISPFDESPKTPGEPLPAQPWWREWIERVPQQTWKNIQHVLGLLLLLFAILMIWLAFHQPVVHEPTVTREDLESAKVKIDELIQARVDNQQIVRSFSAGEITAYFRSLVNRGDAWFGPWLPAYGGLGVEILDHSIIMYEITEWRALKLRVVYRVDAIPYAKDGHIHAKALSATMGQLILPWPLSWLAIRRFRTMFSELHDDILFDSLPTEFVIENGEVRVKNALPPPKRHKPAQ